MFPPCHGLSVRVHAVRVAQFGRSAFSRMAELRPGRGGGAPSALPRVARDGLALRLAPPAPLRPRAVLSACSFPCGPRDHPFGFLSGSRRLYTSSAVVPGGARGGRSPPRPGSPVPVRPAAAGRRRLGSSRRLRRRSFSAPWGAGALPTAFGRRRPCWPSPRTNDGQRSGLVPWKRPVRMLRGYASRPRATPARRRSAPAAACRRVASDTRWRRGARARSFPG